jgi:RAB6A-GEF complex partner protein 1
LHNLEQLEDGNNNNNNVAVADAVRLLKAAIETDDERLGKELLRFLKSIDETGEALKAALAQVGLSEGANTDSITNGVGADSHHTPNGLNTSNIVGY